MEHYLIRLAESCLRKISNSQESITAKSEYLAKVMSAGVRNVVADDVAAVFRRMDEQLQLELLTSEDASGPAITETRQSISAIAEKVLDVIR